MGFRQLRRTFLALVAAAALSLTSVVLPTEASAAPRVDATSADAVRSAYRDYQRQRAVPLGWTGSVTGCVAGAPSAAYQQTILNRVNIMRGIAGLEPVTFSAAFNTQAQAAALIMEANSMLTHYPDNSMACWTQQGADGAGTSNLFLTWGSAANPSLEMADPIAGYMDDLGASNAPVGHRRWILRPNMQTMGSGSTQRANALKVIGGYGGPATRQLVTWPSAGYFPSQFVPTSRRWSIQSLDLGLAAAGVTVRGPNGPVATKVVHRDDDALVWEVPNLPAVEGQGVARYTVTVTGIADGGGTRTHTYDVNVIDAAWVDIYTTPGTHNVAGRQWRTTCEPYSVTERCRTEIWATQISLAGGRYTQTNGWVFNNLTYKPSPRSVWRGNPLGGNGKVGPLNTTWSSDGRQWRTECDTPATGRGGCRAYIMATVIEADPSGYRAVNKWLFNNIVRFS